jgi:hypothetical protein
MIKPSCKIIANCNDSPSGDCYLHVGNLDQGFVACVLKVVRVTLRSRGWLKIPDAVKGWCLLAVTGKRWVRFSSKKRPTDKRPGFFFSYGGSGWE